MLATSLKRLSADEDLCSYPLKRARGFDDLSCQEMNMEDCFQPPRVPKVDLCTHALYYVTESNRSNQLLERLLATEVTEKRRKISTVIIDKLASYWTENRILDLFELSELLQEFQSSLSLMNLWNQLVKEAITTVSVDSMMVESEGDSQSTLWLSFIRFAVLLHIRPLLPKEAYHLLHSS